MPVTVSDGVQISYSIEGSGDETVLLVMGLGARAADWGKRFPEMLGSRFRVVRLDNRGAGASESPTDAWALEDMAKDVVAVLDAVGAEKAHVVGLSMGGMIAQLLALDHASRVNRLVLISTHFGGSSVVHPNPEIFSVFNPPRGTPPEDLIRNAVLLITAPGFADAHPDAIEELVALARAQPTSKRVFATQLQAILSSDRSERVREIQVPTLVIHGDRDPLIPYENGKMLAERIPTARLETLAGVGHIAPFEAPDALGELVRTFLSN